MFSRLLYATVIVGLIKLCTWTFQFSDWFNSINLENFYLGMIFIILYYRYKDFQEIKKLKKHKKMADWWAINKTL